jgi:hypothetical protein
MSNPFDQNFFKFLLGFTFILITSFAILFFVGNYSVSLSEEEAAVLKSIDNSKKNSSIHIN